MSMTYRRVKIRGEALVVAFDMCSSTSLVEELTLCGDLAPYDELIGAVKRHLAEAQKVVLFDPYRFNGDGWILLFPIEADGTLVFQVLQDLCRFYQKTVQRLVLRHLATPPRVTGLTFGIEMGPLRAMTVYGQREYIGRALNVACRLQAAIKDKDSVPAYKALVSNAAYNRFFSVARRVKVRKVRRKLRNISGGEEFNCKKIEFLNERAA
jgi:hypothetical protein